jgi:histidinol dehydrogenase
MSVVPAKIAGVKKILVVTPPNKQGKVDPLVLVAADICDVDKIFKVGGAHAIAALAFGTKSIPQVDKIVGPGGSFVTAAKYLVSDTTSIDMLAGPTELAIIADDSADPKFVALDLISQAEHSSDTTCYLITTSKNLAYKVVDFIEKITPTLQRKDIITDSLNKNGFVAICKMSVAISLANNLAPEHLEIMTRQPKAISNKIKTAGLVLLGQNTPSAASDYLLGTNHILPTNKFGRSRGSLSVLDFLKIHTSVESSKQDLQKIDKYLSALAKAESLPNHYEAVKKRL